MSTAPSPHPLAILAKPPTSRDGAPRLRLGGTEREARQLAAAVLEVLAGVRTPTAAAEALGVSLPRYYAVELRALEGLVAACAPRPKGRVRTAASELTALKRECEQLRRECTRQQALVRASQRTIGLTAPPPAAAVAGKRRRSRKPTARALKAARVLREETPSPSSEETSAAPPS